MNKHLVKIISVIVLLPVVAYVGFIAFSEWNRFRVFQEFYVGATDVIQSISRIEAGLDEQNLKAGMDEWNRKANEKLNRFYASYENVKSQEVKDSIKFTQALFRDVFALRLNFVDIIEPIYSERMQDKQTIRDEKEYEWRKQTLTDISRYITTYENNLIDSVNTFQAEVAGGNWNDKYREYAWQNWGRDIKPQLAKMLPDLSGTESKIGKYLRFFAYMYDNQEIYYINEKGEYVFSNQRYLNDALGVINSMEPEWRKYRVYNPMN